MVVNFLKIYTPISLLFFLCCSNSFSAFSLNDLKNINSSINIKNEKKDIELYYFWATWCRSCERKLRVDLPKLESKKLAVYSINIDKDSKKALFYIKKKKIKIPVLRDPKKEWQKYFKIQAVPSWVLLKKNKNRTRTLLAKELSFDREKILAFIK
tara:strand:+ start:343 stop:807 length:465 start_codon:yes stop_codon:yes gene_type:complete